MKNLQHLLHEPISALTHLAGAWLALFGTVILLVLVRNDPEKLITLGIYGGSLVILFSTSSLFHGVRTGQDGRMFLNRLDHAAIFLLIAGTYTPIVYHLFPDQFRLSVLAAIWMASIAGMAYKILSTNIHGLFNASIYPILSWAGIVPALLAWRIEPFVPRGGLLLLLLGGSIFMVGFLIYYLRRPDPWPGVVGHHEIWHLFVIVGCLSHYLFMLLYVVPLVGT